MIPTHTSAYPAETLLPHTCILDKSVETPSKRLIIIPATSATNLPFLNEFRRAFVEET